MKASQGGTAVWMTWESQPRNRSMARELDVPLYELCYPGPRIRRQLRALVATLRVLLRERPSVVFASNPSLVLTYVLLACRIALGFRLVSDAHYGGVVAVRGGRWVQRLLDFANARADLVIVTTPAHADRIRRTGGTAFVCPDPLPELPQSPAKPTGMMGVQKSVLFICSYELDEPYAEVLTAAEMLARDGFSVFASGSYSRAGLSQDLVPHATLLGYVDRPTYEAYLRHVDVVLDLTTWQDCLVCGAYEAMAAGKPCVLSRTPALTEIFTHGTVFASHEPAVIARAVQSAFQCREMLGSQISEWVVRHAAATRARAARLRAAVGLTSGPSPTG